MKKLIMFLVSLIPLVALSSNDVVHFKSTKPTVTLLKELDNMLVPSSAPDNRLCISPIGEGATILRRVQGPDSSFVWLRVNVTTGVCAGLTGWISSDFVGD